MKNIDKLKCVARSAGFGAAVGFMAMLMLPVTLTVTVLCAVVGGLCSSVYSREHDCAAPAHEGKKDEGSCEKNDERKE